MISDTFTDKHSNSFDVTKYPDRVGCRLLSSLDNNTVTVEIEGVNGEKNTIGGIPTKALRMLNMPKISPQIPNVVHKIIDQGIGVSLLWCRKEELVGKDLEDVEAPVKVFIPTISGEIELTVRRKALARKVS